MANYRVNRINDAVRAEVSVILRDVKDPRVSGLMITVTAAEVTPDLKFVKIFYSVLGEYEPKELKAGLHSVSPYIRHRLAEGLNLRITPELSFVYDDSVVRGAEISSILRGLNITPAEDEEADHDENA